MIIKAECARCGKVKNIDYDKRLCPSCLKIWNKLKYGREI